MNEVESALERELHESIMRGGATPTIREAGAGTVLAEQGAHGDALFLLLNGVLVVAVTDCKVAAVPAGAVDRRALVELDDWRRREGTPRGEHG